MQSKPIEIKGSNGIKYRIEADLPTINKREVVVSLIPYHTICDLEDYESRPEEIGIHIVEEYIQKVKQQYEPNYILIREIIQILESSIVNNHFDYLHVLNILKPKFTDLLQ